MSISKSKDLIGQLSNLERTVSEFSFEELSTQDSKVIQSYFNSFRNSLESHIYNRNNGTNLKEQVVEKEEVEKELPNKNQFIAHVSNQIRTPLNSIIGFANLLNEEKLNTSQHKKVQAIQFASISLLNLIDEVFEYSKISTGYINFETIDFNLQGLLNDVMFLCETLMVDRQIELIIDIDENVPKIIKGDPSKLSEVLLNVLGNSIKFINQGYIKLGVSAKECDENQFILKFSVADTGIGIAKEKLETIFNCYAQAKDDTFVTYCGTGLGLSITKEIVEKQNGEIDIISEEGIGTTITFSIPYATGNISNRPVIQNENSDIEKGKIVLSGTEILVFEDNLMNQHLIKAQLTKWGCKVYTHANLKEGLSILATKKIDLILMDLKMPNLNGFDISKVLRAHKDVHINTVPIVAFSADFTEQDSKDCKEIGMNDFLLKPYTLDELMSTIIKNKREEDTSMKVEHLLQKIMIEPKETTRVDLNGLLQDCFGEIEILNELIKLFKMNALEFSGNVKLHLQTDNLKEVAFAAHKLKAGFAMLKANGMRQLIVELEAQCKANRPNEVKELYQLFLNDYPLLEQNLDTNLAGLNKI
ncbi:response regulator [Maribacter sp. ACAM166]|uniref:response regulator n=1 Tax=Maribacter sp. ACAM166 TaxID=2508996 RepID=UPI0010FE9ABD|nr:response regulator [Maribacter sp. ACAM166]TLP79698.1 response regulator [Maribacter sp. ACAM166]